MAIQDTDFFLIEKPDGTSRKVQAQNLDLSDSSTHADHLLLVNISSATDRYVHLDSRYVKCEDFIGNVPQDSKHWMLVERNQTSYRVRAEDVLEYFDTGLADQTGIITDSHTTPILQGETGTHDLTVASLADPNFVDNESIRMVSAAGETSSYVPVTNTITNVLERQGFEYKLYTNSAGLVDGKDSLPPISQAIFREEVELGDIPNYAEFIDVSYYELPTPGPMSVVRPSGSISSAPNLAWSDDGETWIGSIENKPGGIGPDNPIQSAEVHKYWAFWFKGAQHSPRNFAPDATIESIKLTFADPSPDVKFFQPGDVVQPAIFPDGNPWNQDEEWTPLLVSPRFSGLHPDTGAFNGITDFDTYAWNDADMANSRAGGLLEYEIQFSNSDLNPTGELFIYSSFQVSVPPSSASKIYLTDDNGERDITSLINQLGVLSGAPQIHKSQPIPINGTATKLRIVSVNTEDSMYVSGIVVNGKLLVDRSITNFPDGASQEVKVISRDPVARTMVVDGGSWLGSDGTNSGDVDSQETIVTGPSKSGTAKTDGVPASTTFRIKDSNGQWVDNTNSNSGADHSGASAQNFYVKNASGRVALSRLDP